MARLPPPTPRERGTARASCVYIYIYIILYNKRCVYGGLISRGRIERRVSAVSAWVVSFERRRGASFFGIFLDLLTFAGDTCPFAEMG